MAKLKLPLLSASASGSFAKLLTFTKKRFLQVVKQYSKPTDKRSAAQNYQRLRFSVCQIVWAAISPTGKNLWSKFAMPMPWCKTNPFLKLNLQTGFPCRETPELPGVPYNRKSEWIVGLAKIGITPIGTKTLWKPRWE